MTMKGDDTAKPRMISAPNYTGPDRRKRRSQSPTSPTSVRLRFTADGGSLWEAATKDSPGRLDEETVSLLATLNDDAGTPDGDDKASPEHDTISQRRIVAE
jgi:hypothetical protein